MNEKVYNTFLASEVKTPSPGAQAYLVPVLTNVGASRSGWGAMGESSRKQL